MVYFPKPCTLQADQNDIIYLPQSGIENNYYYQASSMKTEVDKRMIKMPSLTDDFKYVANS
jgi:hypothetical protein